MPTSPRISGMKFGRLTAIRRVSNSKTRHARWECQCDCGKLLEVFASSLRRRPGISCGCVRKNPMKNTPTYYTWQSILKRCLNKNEDSFHLYGGRGITVCDEWRSFDSFFADMGVRPEGTTIERIDCNKGYSKENCTWATPAEQANNKRTTVRITCLGVTKTQAQWAYYAGIKQPTLSWRMKKGWSPEKALGLSSGARP